MTRSGLISIAVTHYLNAVEAVPSVNKMLNAMAAVTDGVLRGELSDSDAKTRLDAIKFTYEQLSKKTDI